MPCLGILGGTFDPVHSGHLLLAQFVSERIHLDEVLFVPAADPPHKLEHPTRAAAEDRWTMVQLALEGHTTFSASRIELDRPGKSYTVDTLRALRQIRPTDEFYLLIGADNLAQFSTWCEPEEILRLCTVVVGSRTTGEPEESWPAADRIIHVITPIFQISSTEIRERIGTGKPIRHLVPGPVEEYIYRQGLYA